MIYVFKRLSHRKQAFLKVCFYRYNNIEKTKKKKSCKN